MLIEKSFFSKKHKHLWHKPVSIWLLCQLSCTQNCLTIWFVKGFRAKHPLTKEEGVELQYIKQESTIFCVESKKEYKKNKPLVV